MNTIILPKTQLLRYIGLLVGVIFMIMSIRVYVNNYLTVENSITQTQRDITRVQQETEFIRNFELPYLQTQLAQDNFLHSQKIPKAGGKYVIITYPTTVIENQPTKNQAQELVHEGWINFIVTQWRNSLAQ